MNREFLPFSHSSIYQMTIVQCYEKRQKGASDATCEYYVEPLRPVFPKFLIHGLTCELDNPHDDYLESSNSSNHSVGYLIRGLNQELKIW